LEGTKERDASNLHALIFARSAIPLRACDLLKAELPMGGRSEFNATFRGLWSLSSYFASIPSFSSSLFNRSTHIHYCIIIALSPCLGARPNSEWGPRKKENEKQNKNE
jgi:hypothetical protein